MDCVGNSEHHINRNFVIYVGRLVLLRQYTVVTGCEGLYMWLTRERYACRCCGKNLLEHGPLKNKQAFVLAVLNFRFCYWSYLIIKSERKHTSNYMWNWFNFFFLKADWKVVLQNSGTCMPLLVYTITMRSDESLGVHWGVELLPNCGMRSGDF
jgi:hypothetical protein